MEKWCDIVFGDKFARRFLAVVMGFITGGIIAIVVKEVIRRW